ncbi:MAG: Gfo/Idh/MocA family protein [Acidimicrobiales bacterium]
MSEKVRLASVGLGWWGGVLANGVKAGEEAELVSCFARTPEARLTFSTARGTRGGGSYGDVLAEETVEGILLATSHVSHADLIEAAAEAGKHIFVEKPLTLTVTEGKRAIAAAEKAGVILQVGHNKRRQGANRRLKELIDGGELGSVVMVETHQSAPMALNFKSEYWRASRQESPLGSMTSLGVHMIDTMHYLMGPVARVFAFSNVLLDKPAIDHVTSIVLEFESGQLGYLGTSFVVPAAVSITVRGTGGTAWNEEDGAKVYRQDPSEKARKGEPVEVVDTVADEIAEFARAIRGGPAPETGGTEGLEVIAVMAAAVASSESGRAESIADFR